MVKIIVRLLPLMLALAWAFPAFGQSDRGALTGTVKDQNGGIVPQAKVTATNSETGEIRKTSTGNEGSFTFTELKAASYRLTVEAANFKTAVIEKIQVGVQIERHVDVTLEAGAISEQVTVTSEAPVLQVDSPAQQLNVRDRSREPRRRSAAPNTAPTMPTARLPGQCSADL